jgi:hypothetical protein
MIVGDTQDCRRVTGPRSEQWFVGRREAQRERLFLEFSPELASEATAGIEPAMKVLQIDGSAREPRPEKPGNSQNGVLRLTLLEPQTFASRTATVRAGARATGSEPRREATDVQRDARGLLETVPPDGQRGQNGT